jgi:dTDP-4-dehydrorhamnose 3,5-epimerase-like enzyme
MELMPTNKVIAQLGRGTTHVTELNIPFLVKRFFYITDVPQDAIRGQHANKKTNQYIICTSGQVEIMMTIKNVYRHRMTIILSPGESVFLPKRTWVEMQFLQKDSTLLVLADRAYDKNEYITDFNEL